MAVQTTYPDGMVKGYAGMIATLTPSTTVTYLAEAAVNFGFAVKQGTADNECAEASADDDAFLGIAAREVSSGEANSFGIGENVRVLTQGEIYVTAGGTATAGTAVYMVPASKKFVTASTDNLAIPGATFVESGVLDGIVMIRLK